MCAWSYFLWQCMCCCAEKIGRLSIGGCIMWHSTNYAQLCRAAALAPIMLNYAVNLTLVHPLVAEPAPLQAIKRCSLMKWWSKTYVVCHNRKGQEQVPFKGSAVLLMRSAPRSPEGSLLCTWLGQHWIICLISIVLCSKVVIKYLAAAKLYMIWLPRRPPSYSRVDLSWALARPFVSSRGLEVCSWWIHLLRRRLPYLAVTHLAWWSTSKER